VDIFEVCQLLSLNNFRNQRQAMIVPADKNLKKKTPVVIVLLNVILNLGLNLKSGIQGNTIENHKQTSSLRSKMSN
jgi:hypothetical protein